MDVPLGAKMSQGVSSSDEFDAKVEAKAEVQAANKVAMQDVSGSQQCFAKQSFELGMPPVSFKPMPAQDLKKAPSANGRAIPTSMSGKRGYIARRWSVLLFAILLALAGDYEMYAVLNVDGMTSLEWCMLVLFVCTYSPIALAAASAVAGIIRQKWLSRYWRKRPLVDPDFMPVGRTAVLMPCYNENSANIAASLHAMMVDLQKNFGEQSLKWFDWFLLSDTRNPKRALQEEEAVSLLRKNWPQCAIYYRRREQNIDSKTGNLHQFCENWGAAYDYLLTLDADSLISAQAMVALLQRIERCPEAGLVQTVPRLIEGESLTARLQQFANSIYGPVVASGLAAWTNPEGNYWGHNAIIRSRAFMEAAGLPHLPGKPPFGGVILSHDFIEAALLRRAGWKVLIADDIVGSYEEAPPSIIDMAVRDRRWCQGNLQHSKVITARGFHWVSRMHILMGILSYCSSVLWLLLICVGVLLAMQAQYMKPEYFSADSFFPVWPHQDAPRAVRLFIITMFILLVPKLLGMLLYLTNKDLRRSAGGARRLLKNVLFETILSILVAPIMMCVHSGAVFSVLLGHSAKWVAQRRDDGTLPWKQVFLRHRWHMLFGVVLAVVAWLYSWALVAWLSPMLIGLLLSVPISAWTASLEIGLWFKQRGWLQSPEETFPPKVLQERQLVSEAYQSAVEATPTLLEQLNSAELIQRHLALTWTDATSLKRALSADQALARVKLSDAKTRHEALEWLDDKQLSLVLSQPVLFRKLVALP